MTRRRWPLVAGMVGLVMALAGRSDGAAAAESRAVADVRQGIVAVRASVPASARTAETLGTDRSGSGVVIGDDGLILTIGYLVLEATAAEVIDGEGNVVAAEVVGYDHDTGFGLLRSREPIRARAIALGSAADLAAGAPVIVASRDGPHPLAPAVVVSRRPFAASWEYLVEQAIYTRPALPGYGGAALLSADGRLVGIGSLLVGDAAADGEPSPGNLFVPIDGLLPILADLLDQGRVEVPAQPWLGVYAREVEGRVFVTRLAPDGPAASAGLGQGDAVIGVAGRRIGSLIDFWRQVRGLGRAGVEVGLDVVRFGDPDLAIERVAIASADRHDWLHLLRRP